jgi:hypothetical protein
MVSWRLPCLRVLAAGMAIAVPVLLAVALHVGDAHATAAKAASDATPEPGSYAGFVGPFNIDFKVSRDRKTITDLHTNYQATVGCGPPSDTPVTTRFPKLELDKGHFSGSVTRAPGSEIPMHYSIRGNFSTTEKAQGSVTVHFTFPHNALPPCNSTDSFSVARAG